MASGTYRIKKGKKDWATIYFRFKQGAKFDFELSTKIQIPKDRWSKSKQEILETNKVDYNSLNEKLRSLYTYVKKEYENAKHEAEIVDKNWLIAKMNFLLNHEGKDEKKNEEIYLTNYIDRYIEESKTKIFRNGKTIAANTRKGYETTLNKIKLFEKHKGYKVLLKNVDLKFHKDFIEFLGVNNQLGQKTIGGHIKNIKLFCGSAKRQGILVNNDFESREFYSPDNDTIDIYLNDNEINKIFNQTLEHNYLKNARDWLIIGLRSGLRISDLLRLKKENINDGFIDWTTKKTEYPLIIPIHPQVESILKSRDGEFPKKISDQKFNEYIKLVAKKSGFNEIIEGAKRVKIETKDKKGNVVNIYRKRRGKYPKYDLVSSHVCRRSFATNLYGRIDTMTIMKITGHKTEKEFLKYIKITPRQYAQKLKEFWKKTNPY